jgi:sulfatase maturation enzyme AslB (radical SAM superfamily)
MYIQITDKCNMTCEHCCFACNKKGTFMSVDTFKAALEIAVSYGETIAIGGGEPTLHPHFEKLLLLAIAAAAKGGEDYKVFIVNNGSIKERAMMLGQLAAAGVIEAKLSYDQFHNLEMVDEEVIEYYRSMDSLLGPVHNPRGQAYADPVRPTRKLAKVGRAVQFEEAEQDCACEDLFVKPNGDIYQCGCPDSPKLGTVNDGFDGYVSHCCYHSEEYRNEQE